MTKEDPSAKDAYEKERYYKAAPWRKGVSAGFVGELECCTEHNGLP